MTRCTCLTNNGARCSRNATSRSVYCTQHRRNNCPNGTYDEEKYDIEDLSYRVANLRISDNHRFLIESGFPNTLSDLQRYLEGIPWLGVTPSKSEVILRLPYYIGYKKWEGSDVEFLDQGILFPNSEDLNELLPAIIEFHRNPNQEYDTHAWRQVDRFNDTL